MAPPCAATSLVGKSCRNSKTISIIFIGEFIVQESIFVRLIFRLKLPWQHVMIMPNVAVFMPRNVMVVLRGTYIRAVMSPHPRLINTAHGSKEKPKIKQKRAKLCED